MSETVGKAYHIGLGKGTSGQDAALMNSAHQCKNMRTPVVTTLHALLGQRQKWYELKFTQKQCHAEDH